MRSMSAEAHKFYTSRAWRRVRAGVLADDKYECQDCRTAGRYSKATQVHHVKHLDKHPELGLETHYVDGAGTHRNLVSLCEPCHMRRHDYQHKPKVPEHLSEERWD